MFPDRDHFGRIFYNQANMSAAGIPQIAVVMGSCTAGGAYVPAMSDESIIVKKQGTIFLGGSAAGESGNRRSGLRGRSGRRRRAYAASGVVDHLAQNDAHALGDCAQHRRQSESRESHGVVAARTNRRRFMTRTSIYGVIPVDTAQAVRYARNDCAHCRRQSAFDEFKARYGTTLVCGFAHIWGHPVGIIANNGILFSESALKGTHFIELCCQRKIPLVFLQNITGFMVGRKYENEGIAKDGAKMVTAVARRRCRSSR